MLPILGRCVALASLSRILFNLFPSKFINSYIHSFIHSFIHWFIHHFRKTKAGFSRVAKEKSISKLYFSKYLIYIMKTVKILLDPAIRTNRFAFWDIFKLILSTSCSLISNMYWWLNHFEVIKQSIIDSRYTHNSGQMEKLGYSEWNKWD